MKRETVVPLRLRRRQSQLVNTAQPAHDPGLLASIGRALWSGKKTVLPPFSPLRTVRETFASYGSSLY